MLNRSARRAAEFGRACVDVIDNATGKVVGQVAAAGTGLGLMVQEAAAAVPANVSTAITDGGADAGTVAGLVLVAIVGIFAFKLMRKGL